MLLMHDIRLVIVLELTGTFEHEGEKQVKETMKTHTCTNNEDALCEACACTPEGTHPATPEAGHAVAGYHFGMTIFDVDGHSRKRCT